MGDGLDCVECELVAWLWQGQRVIGLTTRLILAKQTEDGLDHAECKHKACIGEVSERWLGYGERWLNCIKYECIT